MWDLDISNIMVYVHDVMPISLAGIDGKEMSKNEKTIQKHMKYALEE